MALKAKAALRRAQGRFDDAIVTAEAVIMENPGETSAWMLAGISCCAPTRWLSYKPPQKKERRVGVLGDLWGLGMRLREPVIKSAERALIGFHRANARQLWVRHYNSHVMRAWSEGARSRAFPIQYSVTPVALNRSAVGSPAAKVCSPIAQLRVGFKDLIVWRCGNGHGLSVDRLGRSLQDLVAFLSELHALGIDLFLSCASAVKGNAAAARYTYECRTRGPQVDFLGTTDAHAHRRESIPCR
jgi:hypothetical protein